MIGDPKKKQYPPGFEPEQEEKPAMPSGFVPDMPTIKKKGFFSNVGQFIPEKSAQQPSGTSQPSLTTQQKMDIMKNLPDYGGVPEYYNSADIEKETQRVIDKGAKNLTPTEADPIGKILNEPLPKYSNPAVNALVSSKKLKTLSNAFGSANEAENYLANSGVQNIKDKSIDDLKKEAQGNFTKSIAVDKISKLRNVEKSFDIQQQQRTAGSELENAALNYAAQNGDESVKYLLDKHEQIPESVKGEKLLSFLMKPELQEMVHSNPALKEQFKNEIDNFPSHHPEAASKLLAELIAQKRDELGLNSGGLNLPQKDDTDKIVASLIKDGTLPISYQNVYEKEIRPKLGTWRGIGRLIGNAIPIVNKAVNESPIPTPGLVENVVSGAENIETGLSKSVMNLTGLENFLESDVQKIQRVLNEQYSKPAYEPKSTWYQLTMHGGQMIPFVASLFGGSGALRATNLIKNPELANATMMVLATHGDAVEKAHLLFPGKKAEQMTYVSVMDGLNAVMSKLLPGKKLFQADEPAISNTIKDLAAGKINTDAAKNILIDKFGTAIKGMVGGGEFMGGISAADDILTQVLQGKNLNLTQSIEKGWEGAKLGFLASSFVAGAESALKSNKGYRNEILSFAENPEYYKSLAEEQAKTDPEFAKISKDVIENLDHLSGVWDEIKDNPNIKGDKNKVSHLINSFNEKIKLSQAEQAVNPALKAKYTKEAKNLNEIQQAALNGIPEEKVKMNQAIKEVKQMYNDGYLTGVADKMLESKKTEEGEPKFDETKVESFLKEVADNPKKQVPARVRELAEDIFPPEEKIETEAGIKAPEGLKSTSVIMPEENKVAENIPLTKTEQNAEDIRSDQGQVGVSGNEPRRSADQSSKNIQLDEKIPPINGETEQQAGIGSSEEKGQGAGETPPIEPTSNRVFVHIQYPPTQLSHGGVTRIGTEHEFEPENKYEKSSVLKWNKEADQLMDEGFSVQNLLQKVDAGEHLPSPAERVVLTRYAAELQKKLRETTNTSSPEYDATLKELQRVAATANFGGSQTGASLGAIGHIKVIPDGSYAEFMLNELAANKDAPLTDKQKETANRDFTKLELAQQRLEKDQKEFEEKVAAFRAEQEYGKIKKGTKKDTKKDFASERKQIVGDILLKLSKAGGEGASFLGVKELGSIAPDVLKLAKSFAEQGIEKLSEVIDNIHDLLKDRIPELEKRNIHDIIAGEYNERKATKRDAAIRMENLRIEAQLINKLERLLKGEEPKNEKAKIKRNQEIESLRSQIKNRLKQEAAAEKFYGERNKEEEGEYKEAEKFYPEEKEAEFKKLESLQKKNEKATEKIKSQIAEGNFSPEEKKPSIMEDKELQKKFPEQFSKTKRSVDEYIRAKREISLRRLRQMYANKTPEEKAVEIFSKSLNVPRTLMASFDFSAPLRQGIISTVAHPEIASKALKFMFESAKDEKVYNRWLEDVHNSPRWEWAQKTKLGITDPESLHVKQSEEAFQGAPYAEKIPIVGLGVKASERAYIGFLNKIRWDLFNMYADRFEDQGKTYENNPKLYEGISSMINSETGRGGLKGLENAAPVMNWFLFASKLIASRLNMLGLTDVPNLAVRGATLGKYGLDYGFYTRLPKELRIEAAKDMLKFIAAGVGFLAMAKGVSNIGGGNVQVEDDPRSSDFGKIRSGNQRWDIWGGFQPYARVITQMLSGERKTTTTGEVKTIQDRSSVIGSFLRGKLAPVPAATLDLATGHDAAGQPVTIGGELLQEVTPLLFQDIYSAMKDQGVKALFTVGVPAAFGVGVQNYQSNKPKSSSHERPVHQP